MSCLFDFHQIVGKKTRACLAEMLCYQYQNRKDDLYLTVRSRFMDETTGRRLAGIIFQRFDILDASPYEPLFLSHSSCCYGPFEDHQELKFFEFNPTFCQLLKIVEPKEFESMIAELTESVDEETMQKVDLRFESCSE